MALTIRNVHLDINEDLVKQKTLKKAGKWSFYDI